MERDNIRCKLARAGFLKVEVDLNSYSGESHAPKKSESISRLKKKETKKQIGNKQ